MLTEHLAETRLHVDRVEATFRRIDVTPTANRSASFESAVDQHDKLAESIVETGLGDAFHAATALHTEHWEIAAYTSLLEFGDALGYRKALTDLRANLDDEERTRVALGKVIAGSMS